MVNCFFYCLINEVLWAQCLSGAVKRIPKVRGVKSGRICLSHCGLFSQDPQVSLLFLAPHQFYSSIPIFLTGYLQFLLGKPGPNRQKSYRRIVKTRKIAKKKNGKVSEKLGKIGNKPVKLELNKFWG